jgi:periplasmic protein CpxP/Spy
VTRRLATAALTLVVLAAPATAQDSSRRALRVQRQQLPARPGARGGGRAAGARALDEANAPLRQQVQLAFRNRVRQELNLDQPKMRRLNQTEQGFNKQRNELLQTERQTRLALLAAMQDSAGPDQPKIDQYINQLTQVQRKRAELVEAEQKELSSFLTPLQRAQYLSLKERLNRRLQELNQAGRGAPPPSGPPPGPPPPDR